MKRYFFLKTVFWISCIALPGACREKPAEYTAVQGEVSLAPENMRYGYSGQSGLKFLDAQKSNSGIDREWMDESGGGRFKDKIVAEARENDGGLNIHIIESSEQYVYNYELQLSGSSFTLRHGGYDFLLQRDFFRNIIDPKLKMTDLAPDKGEKTAGVLAFGNFKVPFVAVGQGSGKAPGEVESKEVFFVKNVLPLLQPRPGQAIQLNRNATDFFTVSNLSNINFRIRKNLSPSFDASSLVSVNTKEREKLTGWAMAWNTEAMKEVESFDYSGFVESSGSKDDFWHNQCHVPENSFFVSRPLYTPDNRFCAVDVIRHLKNYETQSQVYLFKNVAGEWLNVCRLEYDFKNFALLR